jgi:hypothetical protein
LSNSNKVVSLYGDTIAQPFQPVDETIAKLEDLLEKAKSGEIKGFHAVLVHGDDTVSFARTLLPSYRALGAVAALVSDMSNELKEGP